MQVCCSTDPLAWFINDCSPQLELHLTGKENLDSAFDLDRVYGFLLSHSANGVGGGAGKFDEGKNQIHIEIGFRPSNMDRNGLDNLKRCH